MKVAIYCRVSTAEQSSAMQVAELRAYCQRRGANDAALDGWLLFCFSPVAWVSC